VDARPRHRHTAEIESDRTYHRRLPIIVDSATVVAVPMSPRRRMDLAIQLPPAPVLNPRALRHIVSQCETAADARIIMPPKANQWMFKAPTSQVSTEFGW
jgi:hypothetical protein